MINGVSLEALITPTGTLRHAFAAAATGARYGLTNWLTLVAAPSYDRIQRSSGAVL
jgi:hypothetical protein